MSTAAILVIGNEILSAKVQDENGPFLARELRGLGVELRRIETVPDEVPLIADALRRSLSQAFGRAVVLDQRTVQLLRSHFGDPLKPALRRLAEVPEGSRVEFHEGYLFPVMSLENVVILPGVPSLLREGFLRIRDRFRVAPFHSKALYFTIGEGALAEHLDATVARFPAVAIGSYPRFDPADHRVKVTFDGRDAAQVRSACEFLKARLPAGVIVREE